MIMDFHEPLEMDFHEPYEILVKRLAHWIQITIDYLPSVIVAFVVFVLFYIIASWCSTLFQYCIGRRMESRTLAGLYSFFLKVTVIVFGLYCAIEIMDFNEMVISILAGAGILGLVLGLAFQELITNLISGVTLTIKKNFHLGDQILVNNFFGTVETLGLRATIIRGFNNETIIIPNKDVLQSIVTNYYTSRMITQELFIGVPCTADLTRISDVLKEAVSGLPFLHNDNRTEVLLTDLEGPIIKLALRYTIRYPNSQMLNRQDEHFSILAVKMAFDKYQIPLPLFIRRHEFRQELVLTAH